MRLKPSRSPVAQADSAGEGEPLLFDRGQFSTVGEVLRVPSVDVRAA
ncbi:hypothetical protein [Intrasporangium sp.]